MYKLCLKINQLPKSLNKKLRSNRFKNNSENKQWDKLIYLETVKKRPDLPLKKASITLVRHSYRTLDYDGLVGSLKPVVDALVFSRIISDDSWKVLGRWNVDQKFRPKALGNLLEILVEEINSPEKTVDFF